MGVSKTGRANGFLILVLIISTASFIALYHYHKGKYTGNIPVEYTKPLRKI